MEGASLGTLCWGTSVVMWCWTTVLEATIEHWIWDYRDVWQLCSQYRNASTTAPFCSHYRQCIGRSEVCTRRGLHTPPYVQRCCLDRTSLFFLSILRLHALALCSTGYGEASTKLLRTIRMRCRTTSLCPRQTWGCPLSPNMFRSHDHPSLLGNGLQTREQTTMSRRHPSLASLTEFLSSLRNRQIRCQHSATRHSVSPIFGLSPSALRCRTECSNCS